MIYFPNFFQIYFLNKEIKVIKEIIENYLFKYEI